MGRSEDLFAAITAGGRAAIDSFILERQSEELFLDFKRSADAGSGIHLHPTDRNNLGKATSGFGNSEGGVIVWGVDCRTMKDIGDVAQAVFPIKNPRRFLSWLEGAVSGCTVPAHPLVRHHAIELPEDDCGFVVTHIPKSYLAPHQTVTPPQFYIRAGSDFLPAPHAVLLGMFGRPTQPQVFHMWAVGSVETAPIVGPLEALTLKANVLLASHGPGLVRDLFLNVFVDPPDGKSEITFVKPDPNIWDGRIIFGSRITLVSKEGFKLAPEAIIPTISLTVRLVPPFASDLAYSISYGHHSSPTTKIETRIAATDLSELFQQLRNSPGSLSAAEVYKRGLGVEESPEGGDAV